MTWGSAIADQVDAMGFKWERKADLASTFHLIGVDHKNKLYIRLVKALEFKLSYIYTPLMLPQIVIF